MVAIPSLTKDNHVKGTIVQSVPMIALSRASFTSSLASPLKWITLGGLVSEASIRASVRLCQVSHQPGMQLKDTLQHPSQPACAFHLLEVRVLASMSHLRRMRKTARHPIYKSRTRAECAYVKEIPIDGLQSCDLDSSQTLDLTKAKKRARRG